METWLLQSQCIIQQKLESRFAGWFVFQFFAGWEKNVRLPAVFGKFPQAKSLQIRVPPSTNLRRVLKKHANNSRKRIGSSGSVLRKEEDPKKFEEEAFFFPFSVFQTPFSNYCSWKARNSIPLPSLLQTDFCLDFNFNFPLPLMALANFPTRIRMIGWEERTSISNIRKSSQNKCTRISSIFKERFFKKENLGK